MHWQEISTDSIGITPNTQANQKKLMFLAKISEVSNLESNPQKEYTNETPNL